MLDPIFGFILGVSLAVVGYPFYTWQFWLIFAIAFAWRFSGVFRLVRDGEPGEG